MAHPGIGPAISGQARRPLPVPLAVHLPYGVLAAAVFFNAVLAVVNGQITALTPAVVIATEMTLIGTALLIAARHYRPAMTIPIAFIVWLFLFMLLRCAVVEPESSIKFFRDVVIAPVFVMLGLCTDRRHLVRYFLLIHAGVVAVAALEAFDTPAYSDLFHVKSYFINTRGLTEENFWNTTSELFVSATRSDTRFISWADAIMADHRVSSVFLEPVSLGAYCVIVSGITFALWRSLGPLTRVVLPASNFFLIVACDGRLAVATFVVLSVACACWRILPRVTPILYLPVVMLLCFVFIALTNQTSGNDDFPGRIAWTVELLKDFDVADVLGFSDGFIERSVDSGIGYLIISQSIFGLVLFWLFTSASTRFATRDQICYTHAISLHVAFNALVSYGFLSIKTASLMWLVRGVLEAHGNDPSQARPPRSE